MAQQRRKINLFTILAALTILVITMLFISTKFTVKPKPALSEFRLKPVNKFEKDLYFMDSNNESGYPYLIVPNIVHYVLFGVRHIQFAHYVSILSVLKNQKPDVIFIHCDCDQLYGHYYRKVIERVIQTKTVFEVRRVDKPKDIFGKDISQEFNSQHSADITRLRALSEFGGVYLDTNIYVVQSLDVFRKFEMTVNWDSDLMGTQLMIAHRNARFLHLWIDSYQDYEPGKLHFNSRHYPTQTILNKRPELVHRVEHQFGTNETEVCPKLFTSYYPNWRYQYYAINLVIRGDGIHLEDSCFGTQPQKIVKFNEMNTKDLNVTFGEMYRELFIER